MTWVYNLLSRCLIGIWRFTFELNAELVEFWRTLATNAKSQTGYVSFKSHLRRTHSSTVTVLLYVQHLKEEIALKPFCSALTLSSRILTRCFLVFLRLVPWGVRDRLPGDLRPLKCLLKFPSGRLSHTQQTHCSSLRPFCIW
jgi:hypothetical protein